MNGSSISSQQFKHLFSEVQVGPLTVKNRICATTHTVGASRHEYGFIDEHEIGYHVSKARGGVAWIGGEAWVMNGFFPEGADDEFMVRGSWSAHIMPWMVPGFGESARKYFDAVHKEGAVAIVQLTAFLATLGASTVPITQLYNMVPHPMRDEHIEFLMNSYVAAAQVARDAGADGIEIACGHDNLIQSFVSPATNKRTDKWGGDVEGRTLIVREILRRVRAVIGDKMALGIRIGGEQFCQGGYDMMEFREMLYIIAETGLLDFANIDVGHCWGPHAYVPPSYHDPAEHREAGKAARADLDEKIKIIFSGRVNEPIVAEELLKSGVCDLVGMTRAGIADPEFANKVKEGRLLEMRRCIACNRCIDEVIHTQKPTAFRKPVCSVNPMIGNEVLWSEKFKPAEIKKNVVVVGGGPAGLEAARISALRGHKVTLIEKGKRVGGQMLLASKAPGRDSFEDYIYFSENEIQRLGINLLLETDADVQILKSLKAEVVVCATGGRPRMPLEVEGINADNVVAGWDILAGKTPLGDRVAVYSEEDYFETPNIAESIAAKGKKVTIFHKSPQLGNEIDRYSFGTVMLRLEENNVEIVPNMRLKKITSDSIEFMSAFSGASRTVTGFDTVVLVCGATPCDELYYAIKDDESFEKVYLVGSAWTPRRIADATQHGANVGMEI